MKREIELHRFQNGLILLHTFEWYAEIWEEAVKVWHKCYPHLGHEGYIIYDKGENCFCEIPKNFENTINFHLLKVKLNEN